MAVAARPHRTEAARLKSSIARRPRALPPALRGVYERAVYRVGSGPGALILRVGSRSAALDRCLAAHAVAAAAFLTAANPGSKPLPEAENRRRGRRLRERLRAAGYRFLPGESYEPDSGAHREASLLVLGIARRDAATVAREFGQAAFLALRSGGPVRLVAVAP